MRGSALKVVPHGGSTQRLDPAVLPPTLGDMGRTDQDPASGSKPTPLHPNQDPVPQNAGGATGGDLGNALSALRARIDEEFRITERLDTKGRQAFGLAAAVFAVVQTVTFGAFAQDTISSVERIAMLAAAVVAGYFLVVAAHRVRNGEELKSEEDTKPEAIVAWCNEAPPQDPEYVSVRLVSEMARVASARFESNKQRQANYGRIEDAVRWGLIFAGFELLLAIAVRI